MAAVSTLNRSQSQPSAQDGMNVSSATSVASRPRVGDTFSARVTTYYPSYSYERNSATEGGRSDNAGLPLTPDIHGADAIIQRAVLKGQNLRENPPVLFVAADQSLFGYGSVLSFSGPQIKKLFLRAGASLADAEYFASVGVKVVVRDVGAAIKTKGRFDLCTSRALENVTFNAVTVQVIQLRPAGKPKQPETPQLVLNQAIAFAGKSPEPLAPVVPPIAKKSLSQDAVPPATRTPETTPNIATVTGNLPEPPTPESPYQRWLSEQSAAALKVPAGFKLDPEGKIIWPRLYGLDTSSKSPPMESFASINAQATEQEVKAVQRVGEPIYAARAGYAERLYNAQQFINDQISKKQSLPAPSSYVGYDPMSAKEALLSKEIGIPLEGLDSSTRPIRNAPVQYGPPPELHSNPNSGVSVSFGSSLGPVRSLQKTASEHFDRHGRYSEQNRTEFESTIVSLEAEANAEELRQKTANGTKAGRGERLTTVERALYQSKLSDASLMKALVNYYKELQASALPENIKQAYLTGLSNLVMAYISGEKYKPVDLPNTKDGVSGVSTLTLPYMLSAVLKGNEASSTALRRNVSDGGMVHVFMRLNGGAEQAIQIQTRKGFFADAPYFRSQAQIDSGVGLPNETAIAKSGSPLRLTPPSEVALEDARARSQETLRNNLRDYFRANPQAWVDAQSNSVFMAYLDRLMFAKNPDGSPADNQHRIVSVQFVERARAAEIEQNSQQRIPKELSSESNLSFYRRSDFENPYRPRTE